MSRENKTRPSVGALGRAVETGSASRADTTSKPQFTPNGPGGQRKIADLLSHGRENAIPRRELERLTGLDGRTVRLMSGVKGGPFWRITPYPPPSTNGPPACATGRRKQ